MDIGDSEEAPTAANSVASTSVAQGDQNHMDMKETSEFALLAADAAHSATTHLNEPGKKDPRIDDVIALLGEFMPADPNSPAANYLSGFMSLRLLMLRQSRSLEEDEFVRTILDSYSSYNAGGRARSDIAMMLARDFIFLSQQQPQQAAFLGYGHNLPSGPGAPSGASSGLSVFGLPSTSSSPQNSPALAPIPGPGIFDSLSIVSN